MSRKSFFFQNPLIHANAHVLHSQAVQRKIISGDSGEEPRSIQTAHFRWPVSIPKLGFQAHSFPACMHRPVLKALLMYTTGRNEGLLMSAYRDTTHQGGEESCPPLVLYFK